MRRSSGSFQFEMDSRICADAVDAESNLLGSLIQSPDKIDLISAIVSQDSFFDESLGALFSIMVAQRDAGRPIEFSFLRDELKRLGLYQDGKLDGARLTELVTRVPHAAHARFYADKVLELSKRRDAARIGAEMYANSIDLGLDIENTFGVAESEISNATKQTSSEVATMAAACDSFLQQLDETESQRGCSTGFDAIDIHTLGKLMPGEMVVVAARPSCGKTVLGWQIGWHSAKHNRNVLFVSLEMSKFELIARLMANLTEVKTKDIRNGNLTAYQRRQIVEAMSNVAQYPITIADPRAANVRRLRSIAKIEASKGKLDLLVVDYLGLVDHADKRLKRYQQINDISREIKQLAKELKIPIVVLCQLNREADGSEPKLSHLRDSGAIEQDADSVIFLHPKTPKKREFNIIVAKNRHGPTSKRDLWFDRERMQFTEHRDWQT